MNRKRMIIFDSNERFVFSFVNISGRNFTNTAAIKNELAIVTECLAERPNSPSNFENKKSRKGKK